MARIRATAIVEKDQHLLVIHRYKWGKKYHILPGGDVEPGESIEDAVLRELKEESSLTAGIREKVYSYTYKNSHNHLYRCDYQCGEIALTSESEEVMYTNMFNRYTPLWIPLSDIPILPFYSKQTKQFLIQYFGVK